MNRAQGGGLVFAFVAIVLSIIGYPNVAIVIAVISAGETVAETIENVAAKLQRREKI